MFYNFKKSLELCSKMIRNYPNRIHFNRTLTTSKSLAENYEGDGKTTVTILNREYKHLVMVDTFSTFGFRLNNGIFAVGPLAAFPRTILQWNINSVEEITPESLSLFCLLEPKLDILVLGTGDKKVFPSKSSLDYLKSNKIVAEIFPTYQAISIFNFLNVEGRCVAGAFLPPKEVELYEEEMYLLDDVDTMEEMNKLAYDPRRQK